VACCTCPRLADLDNERAHFESVPRLISASMVTGLMVGSALAAGLDTDASVFRRDLAKVALAVFVAPASVAVLLVGALLWRLVRPEGRRARRR
jgi:hypothetical protein